MKYLILCEGSNELEIMRILIEHNKLVFGEDDLLGLTPYHARQIDRSGQVQRELEMYPGRDVLVMRVGDVQNEALRIPSSYREKIVKTEKYCTKPELEILLIISEGLLSDYEKVQSRQTPKEYAKTHIRYGRKRYDNSSRFYRDYYGLNPNALAKAILEYRKYKHAHKRDEHYLAELLK